MSCYKIYQINHFDPKIVGRKRRRLFVVYSILTPLASFFINGLRLFDLNLGIVILIVLIITTTIYLFFRNKLKNDNFKTIGEIEFSRNFITKKIGDVLTVYDYHSVKNLELEKHIPAASVKNSKSGYFSYILKIIFTDGMTESLVISDKPTDPRQNLSILETMKTLKKIIKPEVRIFT